MREMPLQQQRLQELEIQSKLIVSGYNKDRVFHLHWTIPHKLNAVEQGPVHEDKVVEDSKQDEEKNKDIDCDKSFDLRNRITDDDTADDVQIVQQRNAMCCRKRPHMFDGVERNWKYWTS